MNVIGHQAIGMQGAAGLRAQAGQLLEIEAKIRRIEEAHGAVVALLDHVDRLIGHHEARVTGHADQSNPDAVPHFALWQAPWQGNVVCPRFSRAIAPLGIGLALVAAIGLSINITVNARVMRRASPLTAMAAMTGTAALTLLVVAPAVGMALPATPMGWFGVLAGAGVFCFANTLFYFAISLIGSVRAAMICNIEPVAATFFAYLILGEALGPLQLVGVTLVIGAILLMQTGERAGRQ